ncbi:hypothetical protein RA263_29300, partial [Pseudomonas syringae pv. tagetis]|uniref:hypothetical protein n=1 Tax=Pseudomonas syringae group genomosp. 7 TaxID=251699 RepID=UPI00377068B2
ALRRRQLFLAVLPFGRALMQPIDVSMDNHLPLLNDYQDSWQGLMRSDGQMEARYAEGGRRGVAKLGCEGVWERRRDRLR